MKNTKDEYRAAHDGRVGADRTALNLPIIPDELKGDMDEVSNLRKKLQDERTISDCLAGAISGTFDYGDAVKRYNASLQLPRNGIPPVNIFTRRDGAPRT